MHMAPLCSQASSSYFGLKIEGNSVPDLPWLARDEWTSKESPVISTKAKKYVVIHESKTPSPPQSQSRERGRSLEDKVNEVGLCQGRGKEL